MNLIKTCQDADVTLKTVLESYTGCFYFETFLKFIYFVWSLFPVVLEAIPGHSGVTLSVLRKTNCGARVK